MAELLLEERVVDLGRLMADLVRETTRTSRELREFKDEMSEFKNEMKTFKEEMQEYKEEGRRERIRMNRQWGELANKMGTLVEDLVLPSLPAILQKVVDCPPESVLGTMPRVVRRHTKEPGWEREFDGVVLSEEYLMVAESKSTLSAEKIKEFAESLPEVRDYFPEYANKKIISAVASLYVLESLIPYAEKQGILVIGFGRENMELLNHPGFTPKTF